MRPLSLTLALFISCTPAAIKISEPDFDTGQVDETDADTDADSDTDSDSDADSDSDSDTDTDTDSDTDTDTGVIDPEREDNDGDGFCEHAVSCDDGASPGDCDDTRDFIYPGATEDRYTAWNEDCDPDGLSDNGVPHTLAFTGSFAFTGGNLIANVEDDSTFETGTISAHWSYKRSDQGYTFGSLGVTNQTWANTLAGVYPSFEVLPPASPGGTTSECVKLDNAAFSTAFTVGGDYGVKFIVVNPDASNNNGVQVYTETDYDAASGPFETRSIVALEEEEYVGYFSPTTSTESLVFCWGNWQGSHGWITHLVVAEGVYTP